MPPLAPPLLSVRLVADSRSGGKFYTIYITPAPRSLLNPEQLYTVDFEYGALNAVPRTGTKTTHPVTLNTARNIFNNLQREKETGDSRYRAVSTTGGIPPLSPVERLRERPPGVPRLGEPVHVQGPPAPPPQRPPQRPVRPCPLCQHDQYAQNHTRAQCRIWEAERKMAERMAAAPKPAPVVDQTANEILTSIRGIRRIRLPGQKGNQ